MKKFGKIAIAVLPVVLGAAACFAACGEEHQHTFNEGWTSDGTHHWHTASCEHTEEISGKAPHEWSAEMEYDDTKHWYECGVCEAKKDEAAHELENGVCACGYVDPASRLIYTLSGNTYSVTVNRAALNDKNFTSAEILEEIEGKKVREIEEGAFIGAKYLKSVTIPSSIKYIKDYAFQNCEALESVVLPIDLWELGNQVFSGCKSLKGNFKIPNGITVIGENLFLNCEKLQGVELAAGTTRIGTQAFAGCKALTSLSIPDTVNYIGLKAFKGTGLTEVEVPASVTTLCSYAFEDCTALTSATVSAGVEYVTGSWFNGCTALEELTLPFVGQDVHPLPVSNAVLGFAFGTNAYGTESNVAAVEQNGVTYYLPKSLKTLTVSGGYIKDGAFDNCSMLQTVVLEENVTAEADMFTNCTAAFTAKFAATLANVKIFKEEVEASNAYVNEELTLAYDAGAFASVAVSVKKGEDAATAGADYTYDETSKKLVFKTAGEFTVTVTASTAVGDGVALNASVAVTLAPPELSEIALSVSTAELPAGGGNVSTVISYTVDSESAVSVVVKKEDVEVTGAYDQETKTVTVNAVGAYTIEVTATRNGIPVKKTATFTVSNAAAVKPVITLEVGEEGDKTAATVVEGTAATLNVNVTYAAGATKKSETFKFYTQKGGNYENADSNDYEWNETDKSFTPKAAGTYKIELTAITEEGGEAVKSVTVTATAADVSLALGAGVETTNGWIRLVAGTDQNVSYAVTGYAGGYNVTFEKDIADATISAASSGTAVTLSLSEPNTVNFKVVYTHKTVADKSYSLTIPVSFVSDADAPVLGEDPFGGTYGELIPSAGMALYYDAAVGGNTVENYAGVTYTIESSNLTKGAVAKIGSVGSKYPFFLIAENFGDNSASGTITVKMTVTSEEHVAAASKTFKVTPLKDKGGSLTMTEYMKAATGNGEGDTYNQLQNDGNSGITHRENCLITKDGIAFNRTNGDWFTYGDMLNVHVGETSGKRINFTLEFDFTPIARKSGGDGGKDNVSIALYFVGAGNWDGNSKFGIYSELNNGGDGALHCGNWGSWGDHQWGTDVPDALSKTVQIKIVYTVAEGKATLSSSWKLPSDSDYTPWTTMSANSSNASGAGSPLNRVQFTHECGCYLIENLSYTVNS